MLLKRKDILNGAQNRQDVYIKLLDEEISLKPLTDGEFAEIEAIRKDVGEVTTNLALNKSGGVDVNRAKKQVTENNGMELKLDLKKTEEQNYYADCLAAAYGLSNDKEVFTTDDVAQMTPIGVVGEIALAVLKISKLDEPETLNEDVEEFRKK